MRNKKGQVTIFIIIAVVIVAIVVLFFMFRGKVGKNTPLTSEISNPNSFLKTCMQDKVEETIHVLSLKGGYMDNPLNIKFKFGDEPYWDISYLCYTSQNLIPCNVLQPLLIKNIESEIKKGLEEEMPFCFENLVKSYKDQGYTVTKDNLNDFEAKLQEGTLKINVDGEISLIKADENLVKKDFELEFPTKLYNNALVANDIVSQQAESCNFDRVTYMSLYPEFDIKQTNAPDESWIYTIENTKGGERFRFAVRSCVPL